MLVRSSISHLPRLEVDTRIHPGIGEIGQQVYRKSSQGKNVKRPKDHGVIAVEHALESEQPDPVEGEDGFDKKRAGKECVHKRAGKPGNYDQHGMAKHVAIEHLAL